jgi:hypothetical protein
LERSRGRGFGWAKEGVDDWDKAASFVAGATAPRSTSSLGINMSIAMLASILAAFVLSLVAIFQILLALALPFGMTSAAFVCSVCLLVAALSDNP